VVPEGDVRNNDEDQVAAPGDESPPYPRGAVPQFLGCRPHSLDGVFRKQMVTTVEDLTHCRSRQTGELCDIFGRRLPLCLAI
jgi:hypothetical protein